MTEKTKANTRIFTDVTVETEARQVPAASTTGSSTPSVADSHGSASWAKYIGLLLLAGVAAKATVDLVAIGHNFGFYFVESFAKCATAEGNAQYSGAMLLQWMVTPTIAMASLMGLLQAARGGAMRWRLGLMAVMVIGSLLPMLLFGAPITLNAVLTPIVMGLIAVGMSFPLQRLYSELNARVSASKIALALLPALLIAVASRASVGLGFGGSWMTESLQYCALVALTGGLAAAMCRATKRGAAFSAAMFSTFPITLCNIANILFTLCCIAWPFGGEFSNISWRATLSAAFITLLTLAAASAGSLLGCAYAKAKHRKF